MDRGPKTVLKLAVFVVGAVAIIKALGGPAITTVAGITPEVVAPVIGPLIAGAIPREYNGSKDWGKTALVTTGLHSEGNFFRFDIHRQKKEVNDGVWKQYRLTLIDPDKNLTVRIDNLRTLESGRYALTLFVAAKVHGWARAVAYDRGVHIISLEAEGDTSIQLWLDAVVGTETVRSSLLIPGIELHPKVTGARLKFDDFRLTRISDVKGAIVHDLGGLLKHALQKELSGPTLVAKINHSLEKHPEKLRLSPDMLIGRAKVKPSKKAVVGSQAAQ
ncbi:MAG TPA: hypothetical protein VFW73_03715 [Lacipirellulaceae bacterium]|nr:hypothetical protein [Lacipirellulaceae bacterium]